MLSVVGHLWSSLVVVGRGWSWFNALAPEKGARLCSVGSCWTSCCCDMGSIGTGTPHLGPDEISCAFSSCGDEQNVSCTVHSTTLPAQKHSVNEWPTSPVRAPSAQCLHGWLWLVLVGHCWYSSGSTSPRRVLQSQGQCKMCGSIRCIHHIAMPIGRSQSPCSHKQDRVCPQVRRIPRSLWVQRQPRSLQKQFVSSYRFVFCTEGTCLQSEARDIWFGKGCGLGIDCVYTCTLNQCAMQCSWNG